MKFKGTIIITDPCYIIKKCLEENPYPFPWTSDLINSPNIDELIKKYATLEQKAVKEVNAGIYCLNWAKIKHAFSQLKTNNANI